VTALSPDINIGGLKPPQATYLGGHPRHPNATKAAANLNVDRNGFALKRFATIISFGWNEIRAITVEGGDTTSKVTAGRLVALGVFALAAKKTQHTCYVTVTTDEGDAIFEVPKMSAPQMQAKLMPALTWLAQRNPQPAQPMEWTPVAAVSTPAAHAVSVADELVKLAALRDQGVLSDDEFAAQKAKLLG
jgi:hypothetical protein